ncbi:disease resistance protein RPV1-like [Prosopis cineraria]|uniref:disease resistance protein RPV1-like n=1 Tax=Prosopis cineraria TaxID=364024 RepID=UPI00240F1CD7|nr:disease resistance protein RPV1-like [Prosopis cineraria]
MGMRSSFVGEEDNENLHKGEEIRPFLLKAIKGSRIAIIFLSKKYASSTFCLDDLAEIVECFKEGGRLVYPVFYHVDPSVVRHQKGTYGKDLARLKERLGDSIDDKLQKWKEALSQVADLTGWHLQPRGGNIALFSKVKGKYCTKNESKDLDALGSKI